MSGPPLVSVVMPVFNGERFVAEAVASLQRQSLRDFELLVVDDGSTDAGVDIVERRALSDPRLVVIRPGRVGLVAALNLGLERATAPLLARMDADDVAHPRRLERQVAFLARNPDVGLVGTAYRVIGPDGRRGRVLRLPPSDPGVRWLGLLASPFAHPTVMLRRRLLLEHGLRYDAAMSGAEDFDLWQRALTVTKGRNLPRVLLSYRVHAASVSREHRARQLAASDAVALRELARLGVGARLDGATVRDLRALFVGGGEAVAGGPARVAALASAYLDLFDSFAATLRSAEARTLGHQVAARLIVRLLRTAGVGAVRPLWRRLSTLGGGRSVAFLAVLARESLRLGFDRSWRREAAPGGGGDR
jgi:glycosyltransferase involved in cell wall biosynthesis